MFLQASSFPSPGSWYYVVMTWDGTNFKLYIDGTATTNGIYTGFDACQQYTGSLVFGQDQDCMGGCFNSAQNLHMEQDCVAIYRRAWPSGAILSMKSASSLDANEADLHALWTHRGGIDQSGNGNSATIKSAGSTCSPTPAPTPEPTATQCDSKGWVFPSSQTSYFFKTSNNFVLPQHFTVETWIKPLSTGGNFASWMSHFDTGNF